MNDKEKEVFTGFLEKIYGLKSEDVASLYNEAGELTNVDSLLQKDSERVAKFKQEKNDQFKAGQKKASEIFEKHLKEVGGIESDLIGTDLIDHVLETKTAELTEKLNSKYKDVDIEKHPSFIAKRAELERQIKDKEKELEIKLSEKEKEWNRKAIFDEVKSIALSELENGYILPENTTRSQALKNVFIEKLSTGQFRKENNEIIILDNEGKPMEDAHGKMISFKEFHEQIASQFFDKKQANQRSNSANQQQQNQSQTIVIKDQSDFQTKIAEAKTPEERAKVMAAAKAQNLL